MALKISGTEVISDDRALVNITGASGVYNDFHPNTDTIVNSIDFNEAVATLTMPGAVSFTEANKQAGRTTMLLLDTTSSGYSPTFTANIKWANGITPTWGDNRYWQINLTCADSTTVRASAIGFETTGGSEVVSLLGTTTTPVGYFGSLPVVDGFGNSLQESGFQFTSSGDILKKVYRAIGGGSWQWNSFATTQWNNVTPSQTYYIRATLYSKVSGGTPDPDDINPLGVWLALSSNISFGSSDTRDFGNYSPSGWTIKVEIATDSAGSNIIATGYYQATWESGA